jgi:hypothetical protein
LPVTQGSAGFAANRVNACNAFYGQTLDATNPNLQRDFPIVEAHDGRLVLGRFGVQGKTSRVVVPDDPSNAPFFAQMQCCFHNQVHFNVRTGGQWAVVGGVQGFLHHIVANAGNDGRCQPSCEPREALLNGRVPPIPRPNASGTACVSAAAPPSIDRDSLLAFRNPMFSFLVWNGQSPPQSGSTACTDVSPTRDMSWRFHVAGQFTPYTINLSAGTPGLSPQSMKFIDSVQQLAIVDGESQGLILLSLDTVSEAHAPYF